MMKPLPEGYREKVYAGVLGKIIGVYLGRPFEQWSHARIEEELGEIRGYVHEKLGHPLIVSDDDITGTFVFAKAVADNGFDPDLPASAIGDHWLNSIIEEKSILWWGGLGRSAEHTAFLNLKKGIKAPESGSIARCGEVMAQQIGAQIFIDGWGLLCPGDPEKAAALAWKAGSVSHDGEALYGAQSVAAMVAAAFEEPDVNRLMDIAMDQVPGDCLIRQMVDDVRGWATEDKDWRATLKRIHGKWGYDQFLGGCHMLPNHAVIILALVYGQGAFGESMMVVNTAGYDTDCNSGNVGCILGVAGGLAGLEDGGDWRGPVADRLLLPCANSGGVVTDAARETEALVEMATRMRGGEYVAPKGGRRFHFSLPGSVQGFLPSPGSVAEATQAAEDGDTFLVVKTTQAQSKVMTATWLLPEARNAGGYATGASPTVYPGQVLEALVSVPPSGEAATVSLCIEAILDGDSETFLSGPVEKIGPGESREISWPLDLFERGMITSVGIMTGPGEVRLHSLGWSGSPKACFTCFEEGTTWRRQFLSGAISDWSWLKTLSFSHHGGTGFQLTGTREWEDYKVTAKGSSLLCEEFGVAARMQGLRRWVALAACRDGNARLIRCWDDTREVLAEAPLSWSLGEELEFVLEVAGDTARGAVGPAALEAKFEGLEKGGMGLFVAEGSVDFSGSRVDPAS